MATPVSSSRSVGNSITRTWAPPGTPEPTDEQIAQSSGIQGDLPGQDFIDQQQSVIDQQLAGEIPQDVQDQVERISAEKSIQSGLGEGQAARNLTARDLGLTSMDIQQQGLTNANALSQTQNQYNSLEETMRQWDDQFMLNTQATNLEGMKIQLAGLELQSSNILSTMSLVNDLLIADSTHEIDMLQDNINTLIGTPDGEPGVIFSTNSQLQNLINGL